MKAIIQTPIRAATVFVDESTLQVYSLPAMKPSELCLDELLRVCKQRSWKFEVVDETV